MTTAITFDFHNTLAKCSQWFHLEVNSLVSDFLRWRADQNGSLVDRELTVAADAAYRRLRRAIHVHGHELPAERCIASVLGTLHIDAAQSEIAEGVEVMMRKAFTTVTPVEGAVETIRQLAAARMPLGVVSSAVYHPFLDWTIDQFGLGGAFRTVTTSASAGFYKSRPEIFWHTLATLDAAPQRSVHVGDSYRFDVEGARRAGMAAVWLSESGAAAPTDGVPPDLVVGTLRGAAPRLLELTARL